MHPDVWLRICLLLLRSSATHFVPSPTHLLLSSSALCNPCLRATNTGDFIAPGKRKVHYQLYGQFYGWLQKYTKGRLTREDVPPGTLR
jgi:hypothetical protein